MGAPGPSARPGSAPASPPLRPSRLYVAALALYLALACAGFGWLAWGRAARGLPPPGLALFLDRGAWALDLALGLAAGTLLSGSWALLRRLVRAADAVEAVLATVIAPLDRAERAGLALVSGFAEELFFRGAMLASWGLAATTMLFALLHGGPRRVFLLWTLFAAASGALLGALVLWRGNLLPAIAAHVLVNGLGLRRLAARAATLPLPGEPGAAPDR